MIKLSETPLFHGLTEEDVASILGCIARSRTHYSKDEVILYEGEVVTHFGVILSGSVFIESTDAWGSRSLLDKIGAGGLFAESYAFSPGEPLMVSAVAAEDCEILLIDGRKVLHPCDQFCNFHQQVIRNLFTISTQKNIVLSRRIFATASRSVRGRILTFLSQMAVRRGSRVFDIPFNREQLADYLNVDRSALSRELGRMQKDGLIRVQRAHFELLSDGDA